MYVAAKHKQTPVCATEKKTNWCETIHKHKIFRILDKWKWRLKIKRIMFFAAFSYGQNRQGG